MSGKFSHLEGTVVIVGSFVAPGVPGHLDDVGKLAGPVQEARVVRATRTYVTLQRRVASGWHTGSHGKATVDWYTGVQRKKPDVLETRVWPPHMALLRVLAGKHTIELGFDGGRLI